VVNIDANPFDSTRSHTERRRRLVILAGLGALAIGFVASVLTGCVADGEEGSARSTRKIGGRGSRVYLDEEGRPFVPTPQAPAAEGNGTAPRARREAPATFEVEPAPGGGEMVVLDGRLQHYTSARANESKDLAVGCTRPEGAAPGSAGDGR
jgi:hypothetical protein